MRTKEAEDQEGTVISAEAAARARNEAKAPKTAALLHELETELYETNPTGQVRYVLEMSVIRLDALVLAGRDITPAFEAEVRGHLDGARRALTC